MKPCRNYSLAARLLVALGLAILAFPPVDAPAATPGAAIAGPFLAGHPPVSASCLANLQKTPFDAFRHVITCNQAWTEYNTGTCAQISTGNYRIPVQPMHGTISTRIIGPYPLGNGACPGHTYTFNMSTYNWTDDHAAACGQNCSDNFTVEWYTPDGQFDFQFPMSAHLAPRITGPTALWWFDGQHPDEAHFPTQISLTAQPGGYTYNWTVSAGGDDVSLVNATANPAQVRSTDYSPPDGGERNISITVKTSVSGPSNPYRITVFTPYQLVHLRDVDRADANWGYESEVHYRTLDQFGRNMAGTLALDENWTAGVVCAGIVCTPTPDRATNWRITLPGGATVGLADWFDDITGESPGGNCWPNQHVPCNPVPAGGNVAVQHWSGEWRIGSTTPGVGMRVQANTWQKYQDHARHTHVVSPDP
jgi:hypothetical protein